MSHSVFVPDLDDEHKEIFEAVAEVQSAPAGSDLRAVMAHLTDCIVEHFAHEERLMRAARYSSLRWHKHLHDSARRQVLQFVERIQQGDGDAIPLLTEYLSSWLSSHTRIADRMMGAFLRNQSRAMWKVTFQAGTKPSDAVGWVDTRGRKFHPAAK